MQLCPAQSKEFFHSKDLRRLEIFRQKALLRCPSPLYSPIYILQRKSRMLKSTMKSTVTSSQARIQVRMISVLVVRERLAILIARHLAHPTGIFWIDTLPATDMTDMMKTVCSWRWLERLRLLVVRERKDSLRSIRTKGLAIWMARHLTHLAAVM